MKKALFFTILALILGLLIYGCGTMTNITTPGSTVETESLSKASVTPVCYPKCGTGVTEPCITTGDASDECAQVDCCEADYSYKVNNPADNGTYVTGEGNNITISDSDAYTFDWESDWPVSCVLVKSATYYNVYCYGEGVTSDSGLTTCTGQQISHVSFCYNEEYEELTVEKTAETSYTRTHSWDIDKSVDTDNGYEHEGSPKIWLYIDGSGDESAEWTVDVTYLGYEDSGFNVSGDITIENTGSLDAVITDVADLLCGTSVAIELEDGDGTPVTIGTGYTLAVGETLYGTYSEDYEDTFADCENVVTVTTQRDEYEGSADVSWGDPTEELYECITVEDTNAGFADKYGEVELCADDFDLGATPPDDTETFTYSKAYAWEDYGEEGCGDEVEENTASIVETEASASATLLVNVQCYVYETAYAKGDSAICFIDEGFNNWGWTNMVNLTSISGMNKWNLWAGAGQCDTGKGELVGVVDYFYVVGNCLYFAFGLDPGLEGYSIEETHVYAGCEMFPFDKKGNPTVAPGQYYDECVSGYGCDYVYVIAHAVIKMPDPEFGPQESCQETETVLQHVLE